MDMFRKIALLTAVAGGFALLGASANGIVGLDGRLEAASRPVQIETIDITDERHDCPFEERRSAGTGV